MTLSRKIQVDPRRRAQLRLFATVTRELQDAFERAAKEQGMTQAQLARILEVDRSQVHRQLKEGANLTVFSLADYAWALRHKVELVLKPLSNQQGRSNSAAVSALRLPLKSRSHLMQQAKLQARCRDLKCSWSCGPDERRAAG
jgi:hypothetical protein